MGDYFKPQRRKFGLATLILACALMCLWMRSQVRYGIIAFSGPPTLEMLPFIYPIPYLSIFIILTLNSAYLLLSRRRQKKPVNSQPPA